MQDQTETTAGAFDRQIWRLPNELAHPTWSILAGNARFALMASALTANDVNPVMIAEIYRNANQLA